MGVAGFAMLSSIVSFVMSFVSVIRYVVWTKRAVPAKATIGELRDTKVNTKGTFIEKVESIEYVFDLSILWPDGKEMVQYVDVVSGDNESKVDPGDQIDILWNPRKKTYREQQRLKKDLIRYPVTFLVSFAILVASILIAAAMSQR